MLGSGCAFGWFLAIALVKAIDASCGIDQLLFSGKEWVTSRTNFDVQVTFLGRASLECLAAGAGNCYIDVFWVDSWFHLTLPIGGSEPHFQTGYDRGLSADRQVWARILSLNSSLCNLCVLCGDLSLQFVNRRDTETPLAIIWIFCGSLVWCFVPRKFRQRSPGYYDR